MPLDKQVTMQEKGQASHKVLPIDQILDPNVCLSEGKRGTYIQLQNETQIMENIHFDKSELMRSELEYEGRSFNDINFEIKLKKQLQDKLIGLLANENTGEISPKKFVLDCKHTVIKVMKKDEENSKDALKQDENLIDNLMSSLGTESKIKESIPDMEKRIRDLNK